MPETEPDLAEAIRAAWNASAPHAQWIVEIDPDLSHVVVVDDTDRSFARVPVAIGDTVTFGQPVKVRPGYLDTPQPVLASVVFASREESRPNVTEPAPASAAPCDGECCRPASDNDSNRGPDVAAHARHNQSAHGNRYNTPRDKSSGREELAGLSADSPDFPAAEPEPTTEPKEDRVSTDLSAFRSRLGLDETADEAAVLAALDARLAPEPPTEPVPDPEPDPEPASEPDREPELVAAAATPAVDPKLAHEVALLKQQVTAMSGQLAAANKEKADAVKASVLDTAQREGKFKPADRAAWESNYDKAPDVTASVLASIAPGTAVPVQAAGATGTAEPEGDTLDADLAGAWAKQLGIPVEEMTRG